MQMIDLVPDLRPTILAARQVRDANNPLARFLPYREVQSVSYRLGRRQRLDQTVPVRAIDAPAVPIRRPGVLDVRGDLPAVTPIVDLSEQDLTNEMVIAQQLAGIAVNWEPVVQAAAGQAAKTVDNTFEAMRGQALSTLKIALTSADGVVHDVDFGADSSQVVNVTNRWDQAGGDAFADFARVHGEHIDRAGAPAGIALTTAKVKRALLAALAVKYPNAPVDVNTLNAYLTANDLPQILTYDRSFTAYDGTKSRVYPEGTLTFLPGDEPVGATQLGVTQEAVQQVQNRVLAASEAPGVTVVTLGKDNPVQRAVKAAAIGLPVLADIDQITVLSKIFG